MGGEGPVGPMAQAHPVAQIPGQKRLESGTPGSASAPRSPSPTLPPSCPTRPTQPCLLSPPRDWPVPLSAHSIYCPPVPLPHRPLTLPFSSCLTPFLGSHLFLSHVSSRPPMPSLVSPTPAASALSSPPSLGPPH